MPEDKPILEKYFLEKFPESIMDEETYHILLVVLGEKPGALVMSAGNQERKILQDFCDDFGLEMRVEKGSQRSLIDKLFRRDTRFHKDSVFIAREEERFDILEESEGDFNGFSDRDMGKFLGYPEEAIKFYEEHEIPGQVFEKEVEELLDNDDLTQDQIDSLSLLGYLPRPEKGNIIQAVKEAERREEVLMALDEDLETSIGSFYLEKMKTVAT